MKLTGWVYFLVLGGLFLLAGNAGFSEGHSVFGWCYITLGVVVLFFPFILRFIQSKGKKKFFWKSLRVVGSGIVIFTIGIVSCVYDVNNIFNNLYILMLIGVACMLGIGISLIVVSSWKLQER
ncbi:MAG TPA: hypothetical protein P5232_03010 [Candidatus Moranbacteria bacterium]|nr:hypothetical protein [Candidatus Moranbacteria bacterium]